jgi:hypothetical protein
LWQLSIAVHERGGPVYVLRWSRGLMRQVEAARDRVFAMCGTDEPVIEAIGEGAVVTMQWRKPLALTEVARMAPTPEVRERRGRP